MSGGARIKHYYYKIYKEFIGNYSATSTYSDVEIERAIKIHEGYSMPGFPSVDVFIYLLQPQLKQLREPAMECLQDVYLYLESLSEELASKTFSRFPSLIGEILEVVSKCLQEERETTKEILEFIIDSEEGYLFTNDHDYLLNRTDIVPGNKDDKRQLSSTTVFVMELRQRIDSYFNLVIRNVRDRVPKTIGNFLVKKVQDKIQFHLYSEINKNSKLAEVLGEHPAITEERNELTKTCETLKHAIKVLQRDPDITNVITLDDKLERDLREENKEEMLRKADSNSGSNRRGPPSDLDSQPSRSPAEFYPPGSGGEPYDRSKRESMNPHMMRAQQQQYNAAQQQQQQPPQQRSKAPLGNLFGD